MKSTITFEFDGKEELEAFARKISKSDTIVETPEVENRTEDVFLVMKKEHEGEAPTMDNIEGICIPMLNGDRFLLYPKFGKFPLLPEDKIEDYKGKCYTEAEALFTNDNHNETTALLALGSEAAKFVRSLNGRDLPSLSMCLSIEYYKDKINTVAKKITGAELVDNSLRWSSCRYSTGSAWYCDRTGITNTNAFCISFTVSAVSAYKS